MADENVTDTETEFKKAKAEAEGETKKMGSKIKGKIDDAIGKAKKPRND